MAETAPRKRLTVDAFIDWAMAQPGGRYELRDGEVVGMSPERVGHNETKQLTWLALRNALRAGGHACRAYGDGLTVPIDETTSYEPDVLVRCGPPLDADAVKVGDPVIVVEVVSPSSRGLDSGTKLGDYVRLPSLAHYLVIDPTRRLVVHHAKSEGGAIRTSVHRDGRLTLDPPGIEIEVRACFPEPDQP